MNTPLGCGIPGDGFDDLLRGPLGGRIACLEHTLARLGRRVPPGVGLDPALAAFEQPDQNVRATINREVRLAG